MQFDFFGTWEDSWQLLGSAMRSANLVLVPDLWYERPEPLLYRALDEDLKSVLRQRGRGFLWSESFGPLEQLFLRQPTGVMAGRYRIRAAKSDPVIDLMLPACYESEGVTNLGVGILGAPERTSVQAPDQNGRIDEVVASFGDVRLRFRQVLKRHKMRRWIWIGPDALRLVIEKKARLTAPGLSDSD